MREANRATTVGDEGKMVAISSGITYRSPLWDSIHRSPISTLQEFLERAEKYMSLDDAIEKIDKGVNPESPNPTKTSNNGNGDNNGSGTDGKKRGSTGTDHREDKRTKGGSDKRPRYEPKFTNYSALKASPAEVYLASYKDVPYKKPPPLRGEISKRDSNKYCRFHEDYGHDTNECRHLKDEIEYLLRSGKLRKFKADKPKEKERGDRNPGFKRQRSPPMEPEPVDLTVDTICGGPTIPGMANLGSQKKRIKSAVVRASADI